MMCALCMLISSCGPLLSVLFSSLCPCVKERVMYRRDKTGLKGFQVPVTGKEFLMKRWTKNHVFVDMNYSLVTQKSGKRAVFKKDYLLSCFIKKNVLPSLECLKLFDSLKASRVQRRWLGGFLSLSHEPSRNYQRRRQRTSSQTCWRLLEPITAVFRWRWG